jgi:hypothetical protein
MFETKSSSKFIIESTILVGVDDITNIGLEYFTEQKSKIK